MTSQWKATLVATSMLALCAGTASAAPATEELNVNLPGGLGPHSAVQIAVPAGSLSEWLGCGGRCAGIFGFAQGNSARIRLAQEEDEDAEALDSNDDEEEADATDEPGESGFQFGILPPGITIGPRESDEDGPGVGIQFGY